jgi:triosephosphate isomerase (TIM)
VNTAGPRRALVAGNWKMNGLRASVGELVKMISGARVLPAIDIIVCPPATLIADFAARVEGGALRIGAQDCHPLPAGAFTGDISAEMLRDAGASAVIVGHSERRIHYKESDDQVRAKAAAARRAGLLAIVCVGETRAERESRSALSVVSAQLDGSLPEGLSAENLVVAYEPVWAIGSGVTPKPDEIAEMHDFIRRHLSASFGEGVQRMRILYGGSVKSANAHDLASIADVDGFLVGGASLKADEFIAIASACDGRRL